MIVLTTSAGYHGVNENLNKSLINEILGVGFIYVSDVAPLGNMISDMGVKVHGCKVCTIKFIFYYLILYVIKYDRCITWLYDVMVHCHICIKFETTIRSCCQSSLMFVLYHFITQH